ncbi:MAG: hypothetical protein EOO88_01155 [Pedobacter sp.]|nr:MAG: hypothetical protein EOO88_01155 [Pedobacter sp.]
MRVIISAGKIDLKPFRILVFLLTGLVLICSCQSNQRFETGKWSKQENGSFPHREKMLEDLTTSQNLKGLPYTDLKNLLGVPDRIDTTAGTRLYYNITDGDKPERLMFSLDDSLRVQSFATTHDPR